MSARPTRRAAGSIRHEHHRGHREGEEVEPLVGGFICKPASAWNAGGSGCGDHDACTRRPFFEVVVLEELAWKPSAKVRAEVQALQRNAAARRGIRLPAHRARAEGSPSKARRVGPSGRPGIRADRVEGPCPSEICRCSR